MVQLAAPKSKELQKGYTVLGKAMELEIKPSGATPTEAEAMEIELLARGRKALIKGGPEAAEELATVYRYYFKGEMMHNARLKTLELLSQMGKEARTESVKYLLTQHIPKTLEPDVKTAAREAYNTIYSGK
jgi:hypothetical protein